MGCRAGWSGCAPSVSGYNWSPLHRRSPARRTSPGCFVARPAGLAPAAWTPATSRVTSVPAPPSTSSTRPSSVPACARTPRHRRDHHRWRAGDRRARERHTGEGRGGARVDLRLRCPTPSSRSGRRRLGHRDGPVCRDDQFTCRPAHARLLCHLGRAFVTSVTPGGRRLPFGSCAARARRRIGWTPSVAPGVGHVRGPTSARCSTGAGRVGPALSVHQHAMGQDGPRASWLLLRPVVCPITTPSLDNPPTDIPDLIAAHRHRPRMIGQLHADDNDEPVHRDAH